MKFILLPLLIAISIGVILIGSFLFLNPNLSIEIQRRFYEKINWRIEPISMQKELRNTKIMGLLLIATALLTITYLLIKFI